MHTITFTCETITPMFLSGADGTTPELRAPSIKGALRFWWRAMENENSIKILREKETKIFGGSYKDDNNKEVTLRSKIIILPPQISKSIPIQISGTPHHKKYGCTVSGCDSEFCGKGKQQTAMLYTFELTIKFDDSAITRDELIKLVKTTFILGGLGKRERRGFGSVMITHIDNNPCFQTKTEIDAFLKTLSATNSRLAFAWFKETKIGKSFETNEQMSAYEQALIAIGKASHTHKNDSLGYADKRGRFASPIYVSVVKAEKEAGYYILLTTLNTAAPNKMNTYAQTNFINALSPQTN